MRCACIIQQPVLQQSSDGVLMACIFTGGITRTSRSQVALAFLARPCAEEQSRSAIKRARSPSAVMCARRSLRVHSSACSGARLDGLACLAFRLAFFSSWLTVGMHSASHRESCRVQQLWLPRHDSSYVLKHPGCKNEVCCIQFVALPPIEDSYVMFRSPDVLKARCLKA